MSIRIHDILDPACIFTGLPAGDKSAVMRAMTDRLEALGKIDNSESIHRSLVDREALMTTAVRRGFSFPHAFSATVEKSFLTIGAVPEGMDFDSLDGSPVYFVFLLLGPPDNQPMHLRVLARISRLTGQSDMLENLRGATTADELMEIMRDSEHRLTSFPHISST